MARICNSAFIAVSLAATLALGGCFEITQDAAFRDNGEVRVEVEIALAAELAALLTNPAIANQMAREGAPDLLSDCGKPWPAEKPLPDGVRAIESRRGKRADVETCTFLVDVADPVAAVAHANEMQPPAGQKIPRQDFTFVRLDGRPGYRFRAAMTPPNIPAGAGDSQQMGKAVLEAMFLNRHMTISIAGQRIENTNGDLAPDARRVTWRYPIAALLDPGRAKPVSFEADILYK